MNVVTKRIGIFAIFSMAIASGGLSALPNNAYEITYYDEAGNAVGFDSYYCGRNHPGLDWGYATEIADYVDLGPCYTYPPKAKEPD